MDEKGKERTEEVSGDNRDVAKRALNGRRRTEERTERGGEVKSSSKMDTILMKKATNEQGNEKKERIKVGCIWKEEKKGELYDRKDFENIYERKKDERME